jgi:hypothetical protein
MSLGKVCFFRMLATIVAVAPVGTLNVQTNRLDVMTPNPPALAPDGSLWHTARLIRTSLKQ